MPRMTPEITLTLCNYGSDHDRLTVDVIDDGQVYVDLSHLTPVDDAADAETGVTLHPDEARALAAVLVAQAEAAER